MDIRDFLWAGVLLGLRLCVRIGVDSVVLVQAGEWQAVYRRDFLTVSRVAEVILRHVCTDRPVKSNFLTLRSEAADEMELNNTTERHYRYWLLGPGIHSFYRRAATPQYPEFDGKERCFFGRVQRRREKVSQIYGYEERRTQMVTGEDVLYIVIVTSEIKIKLLLEIDTWHLLFLYVLLCSYLVCHM